ncbi:MAG: hypothetical protein KGS61_00285 [Verrucomicrobia bacterium]|nr:hypothetical protein [Verrucomicrobiota bacterium]
MNSPATALIWEIWRKNRSGFAALVLLFAVCAGLTAFTGYLTEIGRVAEAESRPLAEANLIIRSGVGPLRDQPGGFVVQLNLGATTVYRGPLTNAVVWSAVPSRPRWIRITMGAETLFEGKVGPNPWLHWATVDLATGRVDGGSYQIKIRRLQPAGHQSTIAEGASNYGLTWIARDWSQWGLPWSSVLFAFSVLAVFAIFSGTEPNAARGFTGIPPRRFALPVRTSTLVACPILLGSATMMLLVLAWSRLVLRPLLPPGIAMPQFYLTLLLLASLVVFQALVWGLPSFPKTRTLLLILLVLGLIPLAALAFSMQHAGGEWPKIWFPWQRRLEGIFALAWLGGSAAAGWGAQQERCGGWAGWQRVSIMADALWKASPRPLEFLSPLHAQFWIEWRRNCRVPMLVWGVLAWVAPATAWLLCRASLLPFEFRGNLVFFTTFSLLIFLGIVGLNLARDGSSKRLALSSFTATRPLTSGSLLTAKLTAGIATWLLALTLSCFSVLVVAAVAGTLDQLPWPLHNESDSAGAGILLIAAISFHLFVGILPLCLTGRIAGFPWSLLPLLVLYGGLFNLFQWVDQHHAYHLLFVVLVMAVLIKVAVAYWGFRRALLLRLISPLFVTGYAALWLFVTAAVLAVVLPIMLRAAWAEDMLFFLPAAVLMVPLARIALSSLALAMNRHR